MVNHLHQLVISVEAQDLTQSLIHYSKRGSGGQSPQRLAILGIYYQNNPFLGIF